MATTKTFLTIETYNDTMGFYAYIYSLGYSGNNLDIITNNPDTRRIKAWRTYKEAVEYVQEYRIKYEQTNREVYGVPFRA